jgi:hypothetical protein
MSTDLVTLISCVVIVATFAGFIFDALRIWIRGSKSIDHSNASDNPLDILSESKLSPNVNDYRKTLNIDINGNIKSNIPASEFFSEFTVCKSCGINTRIIDAGAGTLVGLGLLGTFLGLTLGIQGFDSSNSDNIQSSIQSLLDGMGTAFLTSLLGMFLSLVYTIFEKVWRNGLAKRLYDLNQKLDDVYYIDDVELSAYNQKVISSEITKKFSEELNSASNALFDRISPLMHYQNTEGHDVPVANAIREILTNNEEQTRALKSFSSDLALELNDRLDETLSRQMQQRLIPLMESVDNTTKTVVEHIDQMALSVSSPATDMIERVVDDLKDSLMGIMEEFKSTLSKNATNELENLALSLGTATKAIAEFPQNMANISDVLQLTITEVRNSIAEISNSSAAANSSAMKQMQEQIVFATNSISNAITEVKDVMNNITQSSEQSSNDLIEKVAKSTSDMSSFMHKTMEQLAGVMQTSVQAMSDDIASQQTDLLALQEGTTTEVKKVVAQLSASWQESSEAILSQTENLLSRFDNTIERMSTTNSAVSGTMDLFQQAQSNITGSTAHLQTITGDMRTATETFRKGQTEYSLSLEKVQKETEEKLHEVVELFETAGNATDEYVEKFEVIKNGLGQIFSQIQNGLNEYSRSVSASLQKYLDSYSTSLTSTTDALASTIERQNEMVEMLVETVNNRRK